VKVWFDEYRESFEDCCRKFTAERVPGAVLDVVLGVELFVVDFGSSADVWVDGVELVVFLVDSWMIGGLHSLPL